MTTYSITIGLESIMLTEAQARDFAFALAGRYFPSGHTIVEETRSAVEQFCSAYKNQAAQDCVLLQVTNPETFWI